jgi:hypothetical protein
MPWKDYTECRLIDTDYAATKEQRNIFRDLYLDMQSKAGSIQVVVPAVYPTVVTKTLAVVGAELKTYRSVLDTIADTFDGFDWIIRTTKVDGNYIRTLEIGFPQIGALEGLSVPVFEYIDTVEGPGGNILNYWVNDTMGSAGTHFYGIGGGEGETMPVAETDFPKLVDNGMPRYDADYSRKDVADLPTLQALTDQFAAVHKAPQSIITIEVKADRDPEFGGYDIGDACHVVIHDPRYPEVNGFTKVTRIIGWEYYTPESSNVEEVRISFEGDEGGG